MASMAASWVRATTSAPEKPGVWARPGQVREKVVWGSRRGVCNNGRVRSRLAHQHERHLQSSCVETGSLRFLSGFQGLGAQHRGYGRYGLGGGGPGR